jgi:hypothetical protein
MQVGVWIVYGATIAPVGHWSMQIVQRPQLRSSG